MRLLSFFRALFRRRRSPPPSPTPAPAREVSTQAPAAQPAPLTPAPAAIAEDEVEALEEDDDWRDEEEADDPDAGPDPFISASATVFELAPDIETLRQQARAEALNGEHKLPLSSPAGPGSLAEALNALLTEGCVEAEFVDDPVEGPYMRYRPVRREP